MSRFFPRQSGWHTRRARPQRGRRLVLESLENRLPLATVNLGTVNAVIFGADVDDSSGIAVSGVGDVNGDGFDDVLIGARYGDAAGNSKNAAGDSYLIFGRPTWQAGPAIDLANLGTSGVTFFGADVFDYSGRAVSRAGDVNGDGFDDFLIGAVEADAAGNALPKAGDSYLIFGRADWSSTPAVDLGNLGALGVTFFGANAYDLSGRAVSSAGDVNGDGFDDLLIGAHYGDGPSNLRPGSGETALIFGKANWSATPTIDLGNLGPAGATIFGINPGDDSGLAVSRAGDVNGDGFDDLLIGARYADALNNAKISAGESYLIFGKANWSATLTLDLANLGTAGVVMFGSGAYDYSGISVGGAGDVNGDGFDDLLIGAVGGDGLNDALPNSGEAYLVFGKANWTGTPTLDFANLGSAGVRFFGVDSLDNSGLEVNAAGDMNGDGFDDLVIGAGYADANGNLRQDAGESYVVFGRANWSANFFLETLNQGGITIFGSEAGDLSGFAAATAGDVDGDGFDDLIIGASKGDGRNNGRLNSGESYIVFGGDQFSDLVTHLGTAASETLTGTSGADIMVGHRGNDILIGGGNADVLRGGQGNDILAIGDLAFFRVVGGTGVDTLRLDGSNLHLNLPAIANNRILGIEQIDLRGGSVQTLTLNLLEVLKISDESNTLVVFRDADDTVHRGAGWTRQADETVGGLKFEVYTQGAAILKVQAIASADVSITQTANPTTVVAGGSVVLALQVTNSGPAPATNVTVTEVLPSGMSFNAATSSASCAAAGQTVTCNLGNIPASGAASAQIGTRVASSVAHSSSLQSTATVFASETDPTPNDRSVTTAVTVHREADLFVTATPSASPVSAGSPLIYTVKIDNRGPSDAGGVVITTTLPSGLSFFAGSSSPSCTANGAQVTCNVGNVTAGTNVSPRIGARVSTAVAAGTVLGTTFDVASAELDPTPDDHRAVVNVTVDHQANLQITKTASRNPVLAGGTFQYRIDVANAGPSNATGVTVEDTLPNGLSFIAASSSSECTAVGRDVTCLIGNLAPSANKTLILAIRVDASAPRGTVLQNTAVVSGNEPDPNPNDQSSTVSVTVTVDDDPSPWQNVRNRLDVNDDTFVSPIDALQIINELNRPQFSDANGRLPVPPPAGKHPFLDVTGDNFVVPQDALIVINFLNTPPGGEGEHSDTGAAFGSRAPVLIERAGLSHLVSQNARGDRPRNGSENPAARRSASPEHAGWLHARDLPEEALNDASPESVGPDGMADAEHDPWEETLELLAASAAEHWESEMGVGFFSMIV